MTVEDELVSDPAETSVNQRLGAHLRGVRREKGLSLQRVEAMTDCRFKASVMGAYERGERALTVSRLVSLSTEYGLPVSRLLPSFMLDGARPTVSVLVDGDVELIVERDGEPRHVVGGVLDG